MVLLSIPPPIVGQQNGKLGGYYDQGAVITDTSMVTRKKSKEDREAAKAVFGDTLTPSIISPMSTELISAKSKPKLEIKIPDVAFPKSRSRNEAQAQQSTF